MVESDSEDSIGDLEGDVDGDLVGEEDGVDSVDRFWVVCSGVLGVGVAGGAFDETCLVGLDQGIAVAVEY